MFPYDKDTKPAKTVDIDSSLNPGDSDESIAAQIALNDHLARERREADAAVKRLQESPAGAGHQ